MTITDNNFPEYGKTASLRFPWRGYNQGEIVERHISCEDKIVFTIRFDEDVYENFFVNEFTINH